MTLERLAGRDPPGEPKDKHADRRLSGWKEIGAFFGKNERTVKRWESRGLPIHRLPGETKAAVFAYPEELEAWLTGSREAIATEAMESMRAPEEAVEAAPSVVGPLAGRTDRLRPMLAVMVFVVLLAV